MPDGVLFTLSHSQIIRPNQSRQNGYFVMLDHYKEAEMRFLEIDVLLNEVTDKSELDILLREWGKLRDKYEIYQQYQQLKIELKEVKQLTTSNDSDIRELAHEEILELNTRVADLEIQMLWRLRPDPRDSLSVVIEFNTEKGDNRQHDLCYKLLRMFTVYLVKQNMDIRFYDSGYCSDPLHTQVIYIKQKDIYRKFKFEHGTHRFIYMDELSNVQEFDMSIEVIPDVPDHIAELDMDDVENKTLRCRGAGGMSVTRYEMARLFHKPTGLSASVTDRNSYWLSVFVARKILASKVYNYQRDKAMYANRQTVIRQYDTIKNVIIDHRLSEVAFNLEEILVQGQGQIADELMKQYKTEILKDKTE